MVPSTYEPGKLYNVLPSGNRAPDNKGGAGYDQTRADFDFDRGSNAAATRINSSGLIEKYRENLLVQSNNFGTTWAATSASLTSGQSGYDGSSGAWKLQSTTIYSSLVSQTLTLNGVQTFSVYAKAGTANYLVFYNNAGSIPRAWYDLSNGTIESTLNEIDAKIESVGNGWYRCSMTYNQNISQVNVYVSDANGSFSSAIGSNIYIQSAQLESGLCSTEYLNSTSVTAKAGVLIDLPRINYDANGENGALLLEPSRQQLITQSEYFASSDWIKTNSTITNNSVVSPEGLQNAATHTNTASNQVFLYQYPSGTGTTFTCSVFAKKNTNKYLGITMTYDSDTTKRYQVIFNLEDGTFAQQKDSAFTLTNRDYDIEDYGNGWYRCSITSTGTNGRPYMVLQNSNILSVSFGDVSLDWNDATIGSAYYYGAQLEANASYATSYIPNHSGTGGVTRAADSCSVTGASDVIGQTEGTMFCEVSGESLQDNSRYMSISDFSDPNKRLTIYQSGGLINVYCSAGATFNITYNSPVGTLKIAVGYKSGDYVLYVNGVNAATSTESAVVACSDLGLGVNEYLGTANPPSVGYSQTALFNERLTDSELATLTTL